VYHSIQLTLLFSGNSNVFRVLENLNKTAKAFWISSGRVSLLSNLSII